MTIKQLMAMAAVHGRYEHQQFLAIHQGPCSYVCYRDGRLLFQTANGSVIAFQADSRNDALIINAAFEALSLDRRYRCTWSEGQGAHVVEYDEGGNVLFADTAVDLLRRLHG
jgi:hypothetical protein